MLANGAFNYIEFLMVARGVAKELDELKEKAEHSRINSGTFSLSESTGSVYNGQHNAPNEGRYDFGVSTPEDMLEEIGELIISFQESIKQNVTGLKNPTDNHK